MRRRALGIVAGTTFAGLAAASPALADAIDGDWCASEGRHFTIRGPEITTPGGRHVQGEYGRHDFAYTAPAGEPEAGRRILMVLQNETTLHLTVLQAPDKPGPVQTWRRCSPTS